MNVKRLEIMVGISLALISWLAFRRVESTSNETYQSPNLYLSHQELDASTLNCFYRNERNNETLFVKCLPQSFCMLRLDVSLQRPTEQNCFHPKDKHLAKKCLSTTCKVDDSAANRLCCCSKSLCNVLVVAEQAKTTNKTLLIKVLDLEPSNNDNSQRTESKHSSALYIIMIFTSAIAFLVIAILVLYLWKRYSKESRHIESLLLDNKHQKIISNKELRGLDSYLHGYIIHNGNHTTIRLGMHNGTTVAVKVYPPRFHSQLANEKEIYNILPQHPNIAKFIRTDRLQDSVLLLDYYSKGSLLNYLWDNTLTWNSLFLMITSIAKGLAYMHNDLAATKTRPMIIHRDLNSRNILMRDDGECVLADFGFSLILGETCPFNNFSMAGSPRYMAPEILDRSAICLDRLAKSTDWRLALKKIDSYSLGLVIWEIALRCEDLYRLQEQVAVSQLPFECELGSHPCPMHVKDIVCTHKIRPSFPKEWNHEDPIVSLLKLTVQECWLEDSDSRLSPLCVLNRTKQLSDILTKRNLAKMRSVSFTRGRLSSSEPQLAKPV